MGRRALPKLDPATDLSRHLRTFDTLPHPWDAAALFADDAAPLEIEVGSGKGLFLQSAATALPDHNFLGIEVARKYAHHTAVAARQAESHQRRDRRGRRAARVPRTASRRVAGGSARLLSRSLVEEAAPQAARHERSVPRRRRPHALSPTGGSTSGPTSKSILRPASPWSPSTRRSSGRSKSPSAPPEHDLDFRTHFERRMRLAELPVYRSEFRKDC